MKQLPAIILSGFLGAGKTTLLNRLLDTGLAGKKAGVIVNDFGKLNIDGALVRGRDHAVLELSNGCVCCTLGAGLAQAICNLSERDDLDLLLIEASGISVSSAMLQILKSPELADRVRVSNVLAVVDARRYPQVLHSLPVIRDQISAASAIVLNHCDQVDAATIEAAKRRLREENAIAPIVATDHAEVCFDDLFHGNVQPDLPEYALHHDAHWYGYEIEVPHELDPNELLRRINQLPDAVERVKGFIQHGGAFHLLQKAGPFPGTLERWAQRPPTNGLNTLVLIAREPIAAEIQRALGGRGATSHAL